MIDRLDHSVLTIQSLEITCEFYKKVMGMEVITFAGGRKALHFGAQKIKAWKNSIDGADDQTI